MSAIARAACESCTHVGAFHVLPRGRCRVNGCSCERFDTVGQPNEGDGPDRTMVVRIPEGFFGSVTIYPVTDDEPELVHVYKGEGLTICGREVTGPCPDCETS